MNDALQQAYTPGHPADLSASQARLESVSATEHPQCLMCGAANPFGMKLKFKVQSDGSVLAVFPCRSLLQSYPEALHGGAISALLDAAMTNALFSIGVVAMTAELTVRFVAPVSLNRIAVVRAAIEKSASGSLYYVRAELEQDQRLMARASAKFLVKGCLYDAHGKRTQR
jgi:acyl-coenzyme A thioesterase PaaI-like protein